MAPGVAGAPPAIQKRGHPVAPGVVADDHRLLQKAVPNHAPPQRPLGGDLHRIGMDLERGDPEALQMGRPRRLIREPLALVLRQQRHKWAGQMAPAHVRKRRRVDHVVPVAGPQQRKKVQPALRKRRPEPGKAVIADLRANAVRRLVPRSGVIDRDPSRRLHTGPQNVARLGHKPVLAPAPKPHHLAVRDVHPDIAQQTHQAANGHLAAVILGQHEAPQLRPEVTREPRRQRRHHHPAIGGEPALAPVADHMRTQHKILNHIVLVALETRAVRNLDLDDPILIDHQP